MRSGTRLALMGLFAAGGVVAGLGLARSFDATATPLAPVRSALQEAPAGLASLQDAFAAVAETASPSVVHITTGGAAGGFLEAMGVGSGVIVSADGHIITNHHVVDGASGRSRTLRVRFVDSREFPAKVLGTDPESDLALLKIDVPRGTALVPATFADSDKVRVGDWCLAIGSPFGYNHSVTAGIVSAKHRRAQLMQPYQDFLQTDAAINPGNSGGALVNIRGELIGINTAIITESRGSDGVGLAIASNLVQNITRALMKEGRVRRGYLGVRPVDFDDTLVQALREEDPSVRTLDDVLRRAGLRERKGVFLYTVEPDSPAARAGLRERDVLLEINGAPIRSQNDLLLRVAEIPPGREVTLTVLQEGRERELQAVRGERPPLDLRRRR